VDQQSDFAAHAVTAGQLSAHFGYRSAQKLLMDLGQFAGQYYAQGGAKDGFKIRQGFQNPVRRFVEN